MGEERGLTCCEAKPVTLETAEVTCWIKHTKNGSRKAGDMTVLGNLANRQKPLGLI